MDEIKPQNRISLIIMEGWPVLLLASFLGFASYGVKVVTGSNFADPLFIALLLGILARVIILRNKTQMLTHGFSLALVILIPIGTVLYGAINLNFVNLAKIDSRVFVIMVATLLAYFVVILLLGKLLNQREKTTYLIATGSAVCGASAIAITAPAIDAEPNDVSVGLISVFIAGVFGLFIFLPFLINLFEINDQVYAILSGTTLQFTGFVKTSVGGLSKDAISIALATKATRYMALFLIIPIFSSMVKRKFHTPWFLWAFLAAGLVFSFVPKISETLTPVLKPILDILWSIAMAAIGLNADIRMLISDNGLKALLMAFVGFFVAVAVSLTGLMILF
ncbi:MAG: putative sulfate exporter family transporter [Minisyncoccia bacterium]